MGIPAFQPLKFAFLISVSVAASYASSSALFFPFPNHKLHLPSQSATSVPKATAKDLLTLLGPSHQASSLNQQEARELNSCFKFLVPFSPSTIAQPEFFKPSRRSLTLNSANLINNKNIKEAEDNELIWWPPQPVMELARLAVDSGADPGVIHRALDPTVIQVPDVEGSKEAKCELTRTPYGRRFINEDLNAYLKFLFKIIEDRGPRIGLNAALNRYDFFHGHLFIAVDSGRLGILFHAKEYPAYDKDVFPYNMGYCQKGSNVAYDNSMNLRNILWLAPLPSNSSKTWLAPGVLVVLDARPDGIVYKDLVPDYVKFVRTIYEDDFGEVVLDVNFLNVGTEESRYELFLC